MLNFNYQKLIKYSSNKKLCISNILDENINIIKEYNNVLSLLLTEINDSHCIKYSKWIYYLETIYTHINFITKQNKMHRLKNMYKLIEGISKKAADINIDLIEILNKEIIVSRLFLQEYKKY